MKRVLSALPLAALVAIGLAASACASAETPPQKVAPDTSATVSAVDAVTLPPLPAWTDRYRDSNVGDMRFFEISALMEQHSLTRLQAVGVQNHYRDLSRAGVPGGPDAWLAEALRRVARGELESGLDAARLAQAPFIVVFDLDETLYDQRVKTPEGCHDLTVTTAGGKVRRILRVPGWQQAFEAIRQAGGAIVIFSANLDDKTLTNLAAWTWEGQPLTAHPDIVGVMTNSHLTLQSKHEGAGRTQPRKGSPVIEPSKDLRIVDPSLERAIIVDDNPKRLFQYRNTRAFKKFHGDAYCAAVGPLKIAFANAMPTVTAEITQSAAWAKAQGLPFAHAYLPYTLLGRHAVDALVHGGGLSEADAVAYVRAHPDSVDNRY